MLKESPTTEDGKRRVEYFSIFISVWQTLLHNIVLSTPRHERDSNSQL
jgi:hypothetical protein